MTRRRKPGQAHDQTGRSKGSERFVRLNHSLLRSAAWLSLSCAQRCIYLAIAERYNGRNNGEIAASVRDLARLANCNKDTAAAAVRILEERGFIVRVTEGGFSRKVRHAAEYRLTAHPHEINQVEVPATREFAEWKSEEKRGPKSRGTVCEPKGPSVPRIRT